MLNDECKKYAWTFNGKQFSDLQEFEEEFTDYNDEICRLKFEDFIFINSDKVKVIFEGIPEGEQDPDEDLEEIFASSSKGHFSFIDLIYQFHHRTSKVLNTKIMDHVFYEGFSYEGIQDGVHTVRIYQGS